MNDQFEFDLFQLNHHFQLWHVLKLLMLVQNIHCHIDYFCKQFLFEKIKKPKTKTSFLFSIKPKHELEKHFI